MKRHRRSTTLLELIIALTLFFLVVIAVAAMEVYSRNQAVILQRRAKLSSELSGLFEDFARRAKSTVGNGSGIKLAVQIPQVVPQNYNSLQFYLDANQNGLWDAFPNDYWTAYVWTAAGGPPNDRYQIRYYANNPPQPVIRETDPFVIIATGITDFVVNAWPSGLVGNTLNHVQIRATACWNVSTPAWVARCGAADDNPTITMTTTLNLPMVSAN